MTIHYHGLTINPQTVFLQLAGHHFCSSFMYPSQTRLAHEIGQSVMLDNGAFSAWRQGNPVTDWTPYYEWSEKWLECPTTWAVIPDIIDCEDPGENTKLISDWPHGKLNGAPVWHLDEPIGKLLDMIHYGWHRICFGSAGKYATVGDDRWHRRVTHAFNQIVKRGPIPWIHMLRGMSLSGDVYPFSSMDSTDVARNHNRGGCVKERAMRWDRVQTPFTWEPQAEQRELL